MFVTLTQGRGKSITGTDGTYAMVSDGSLLIDNDAPEVRIKYSDPRRGAFGGMLYNCSPREVVGSIMRTDPQPFRTVVRADSREVHPVLGVLVKKYRDTVCEVVQFGAAPVFDRALVAGARYYLGPSGSLVRLPITSAAVRYVHYIGTAADADTLIVCATYPLVRRDV